MPTDLVLLRRLSGLSGLEYGLLRTLARHEYLELEPVEALLRKVCMERMNLARGYLEFAATIRLASTLDARQVISRSYYAMHHAARAVVFATRREDVTSHEGVVKAIGRIFDETTSIALREQLWVRNSVEYEVYPHFDPTVQAHHSLCTASAFLDRCGVYLEGRWRDAEC